MKRKSKKKQDKRGCTVYGLKKMYYYSGSIAGFIVTTDGICQFQKHK